MFGPRIGIVWRNCLDILAEAVIIGVTFLCLALIGLILNRALQFVMRVLGVGSSTEAVLTYIAFGYFLALGVAMMITSLNDVYRVVKTSVFSSGETENDREQDDI